MHPVLRLGAVVAGLTLTLVPASGAAAASGTHAPARADKHRPAPDRQHGRKVPVLLTVQGRVTAISPAGPPNPTGPAPTATPTATPAATAAATPAPTPPATPAATPAAGAAGLAVTLVAHGPHHTLVTRTVVVTAATVLRRDDAAAVGADLVVGDHLTARVRLVAGQLVAVRATAEAAETPETRETPEVPEPTDPVAGPHRTGGHRS